jgi:endo-1,4-beta-xylanase
MEGTMQSSLPNRWQWFRQVAGGITAASALAAATGRLVVRAFEPDGKPADAEHLGTLLLINADGQPYHVLPRTGTEGTASIEFPKGRFGMMMVLPVRDFGRVYLYADNSGALYPSSGARVLLLNYEFARSRADLVRHYVKAAKTEGVAFSPEMMERLNRGEAALARASAATEPAQRAARANESLADTLWAGEMAAVERARHRIGRNGPRPGFLFGCNAFDYAKSDVYARLFGEVFNYATVPFYLDLTEKVEGKRDYSEADTILERMAGSRIFVKGHPLIWLHYPEGVPEWLKGKSWPEIKQTCRDYILTSVSRHRSRIHAWEIVNEAHDWANDVDSGLDHDQILELMLLAADSARTADPTCFRVVNSCCTWGEYAATGRSYRGTMRQPVRTPLQYYKVLEEARIPYEAVGLQVYNPARDMLELEPQVERFCVFGKPVHITELGVPSTSVKPPEIDWDEGAYAGCVTTTGRPCGGLKEALWHGSGWTPEIQADWLEQFYTICYSKPQIQAITWWDFKDRNSTNPHGLLNEKMQKKPAYDRVHRLVESWKA